MKKTYITLTPIALVATMMMSQAYADHTVLDDVVVTATPMTSPFLIETDPKQPRQPLPAHDGADYLKTIPGFTVMRKGGTDGEAVFRGMLGSRLNIMIDDQNVVGGCNGRMDAPTAYIFPEAYDKLTVIKGPQTVQYGNMGSAATIKFDRDPQEYKQTGKAFQASGLVGSFGRHDEFLDAQIGNENLYVQAIGTNSQSGNYKDGSGKEYHSGYHRWSGNLAFGLTPDHNTKLEFSAARSDGWAKYADRMMDGTKFLRENYAFKFEKKNISPVVEKIGFQISQNTIDHVMDDITYRTHMYNNAMHMPPIARVDHDTKQSRLYADLNLSQNTKVKVGADYFQSTHSSETFTNANPSVGGGLIDNAKFKSVGAFAELTQKINESQQVVAGYRLDSWTADNLTGNNAGSRDATLQSAFIRHESMLTSHWMSYFGFGHTERAPDYWEAIGVGMGSGASFLTVKNEKSNQVDLGLNFKSELTNATISTFYNKVDDFIAIRYNSDVASMSNGSSAAADNIQAYTYGIELSGNHQLTSRIKVIGSAAYVQGRDQTHNMVLGQLPPLDLKLGATYDDSVWSFGGLVRYIASKSSYNNNGTNAWGNIAGYDFRNTTNSATIFSINAGYRASKKVKFYAGVDNLFDKTYAEFISRTGYATWSSVNPQTTRVNEPGRTAWLKATIALD